MSKVIVSLPGLSPDAARQLVRSALYDWRRARAHNYVETRYAHMGVAFCQRRHVRLALEMEALDNSEVDTLPASCPACGGTDHTSATSRLCPCSAASGM